MKILPLDKAFDTNVEYKAEHNKFYVFEKLGSDVNVDYIEIEGRRTTPLDATLAPQYKTSDNKFGRLALDDLYLVVPPLHRFKFVSSASGKVVAQGKLGILSLGEGIPADLSTRFKNIHLVYKKPYSFTKDLGTDVSMAAGEEVTVAEIKPTTIERITLNDIIGLSATNAGTVTKGYLGVIFYYDDTPLDILDTAMGRKGIDFLDMPLPPTGTGVSEPFSLHDFPIVVEPDHTLKINVINNSGAAITPPTGTSISFTCKFVAKYEIIG